MSRGGRGRGRRERWGENGFEGWGGYMAAKIAKLEDQFENEAKKEQGEDQRDGIFNGVAIFVNGYTGKRALNICFLACMRI